MTDSPVKTSDKQVDRFGVVAALRVALLLIF